MEDFSNDSNSSVITRRDIIYTHCFVALMIDRAVTPLWYFIGITGNVVSAAAWLQPRMRKNSSSAIYLSALSVNDTLFLLLHPLQELKYAWFVRSVDYPGVCETYAMVFLVTQYLAPVITLGFSVDRYIAVCHPFKKKRFCTVKGAVRVVAGSVLGCLALGAIQPYLWTYDSTGSMGCSVRAEARLGGQRSLWSIWSWSSELVVFLLVPLLNLLLNVMVIREICHLSKTANAANVRHLSSCVAATNAMLLLVSFYVIFTTLPATIVYVLGVVFPAGDSMASHELIAKDPVWRRHFVYMSFKRIVDEVCLSHYACNFFLFAATGTRFRRLVRKMLFRGGGAKTEQQPSSGSSGSSRKKRELNTFIVSNVKRGRQLLNEGC